MFSKYKSELAEQSLIANFNASSKIQLKSLSKQLAA